MSAIVPKADIDNPYDLNIWLKVNGEYRQKSNTSFLLFKISEIISSISQVMTLEPGVEKSGRDFLEKYEQVGGADFLNSSFAFRQNKNCLVDKFRVKKVTKTDKK